GERRVRRDAVRHGLDRRLGVDCHDAGLDQVGRAWADDDESEELTVALLVNRLDPTGRVARHHRARVRDPRKYPDGNVVLAVALLRLRLGETHTGDLRIGVDRPRHGRLAE